MSRQQQQQQQQQNQPSQLKTSTDSFLNPAAAASAIVRSKQDYVQVDGLVVLKIVKHCQETGGGADLSQGILTGMVDYQDNAKRIEITNCFGLPNDNNSKLGADYDDSLITDNLKTFRHLNVDHLIIGWYQSSLFGNFINKNFIEDHFMYQSDIEDSIVLIYGFNLFLF
jgi:translation initiation factor 3 subunit H